LQVDHELELFAQPTSAFSQCSGARACLTLDEAKRQTARRGLAGNCRATPFAPEGPKSPTRAERSRLQQLSL
jgi:hypothetical protein